MALNRRDLIKGGIGIGATSLLPGLSHKALAAGEEPHFFLQVFVQGGWDPTYFFDARKKDFFAKGFLQNYLYVDPAFKNNADPVEWQDAKGRKCLASPLVNRLKPYFPHFTVVNGIHMSPDNVGHPQNVKYLLTGSNTGEASYHPLLTVDKQTPMDFLWLGDSLDKQFSVKNGAGGVEIMPDTTTQLGEAIRLSRQLNNSDLAVKFIQDRYKFNGDAEGAAIAQGVDRMFKGYSSASNVQQKLVEIAATIKSQKSAVNWIQKAERRKMANESDDAGKDPAALDPLAFMQRRDSYRDVLMLAHQFFKFGLTRSATIFHSLEIDPIVIDFHAPKLATNAPRVYERVVDYIEETFKYLKETPFDSRRSLMDVTTVMICSEFGRTMGQFDFDSKRLPVEETGTDHNPFCNFVILGGKGIKCGQILGASDMKELTPAGALPSVSKAHEASDLVISPTGLSRFFGQPVNPGSTEPLAVMPSEYVTANYIRFPSIVNSLMQVFGLPTSKYFKYSVGGESCPVLTDLV